MGQKTFLHFALFLQFIYLCYGCQIEGISNWLIQVEQSVYDTQDGIFFERNTSSIQGIANVVFRDGLNRGPYLEVSFDDSQFRVATNNAFKEYEEYETSSSMGVTVTFSCTGGSTSVLVMVINVIDTNNNAPRFLPSNNYEFSVIPPLPPGFAVTGCENSITVRDIDLTTYRIDFTIEDNPYFEIFYDTSSSTPKEFSAVLRAKTFIRSISEDFNFTISATDVDETGDPPLTETATIRITADEQFQLPDELVFSRTFYLIHYTAEHSLESEETIYLRQGYDDDVKFSFEGQYSTYFKLRTNGNEISFDVNSPLTWAILRETEIYLIVRAEREYTTGTSATVIIKLPTDSPIDSDVTFDKVLYSGRLEKNVVTHEPISILEYSGNIIISGDYGEYFIASVSNGSVIVQTQTPISVSENYIVLKLVAGPASAVLLLDFVEDSPIDSNVTFDRVLYSGRLENNVVTHEPITILEYSGNIIVSGDYGEYFTASLSNGSVVVQTQASISVSANYIVLKLVAGPASAVLLLDVVEDTSLPSLSFSSLSYVVQADDARVGLMGQVTATADNGEAVTYTLEIDNGSSSKSRFSLILQTVDQAELNPNVQKELLPQSEQPQSDAVCFKLRPLYRTLPQVEPQLNVINFMLTKFSFKTINIKFILPDHSTEEHLRERLSINNNGEIYTSAPIDIGAYTFVAVATTVSSHVSASAQIHLIVETSIVCNDTVSLPPLLIIERYEEEPHLNLVPLDRNRFPNCQYQLINKWPVNQTWLYVDQNGLHTQSIDREHGSIAFMHVSQIQVELFLYCDNESRKKRSIGISDHNDLKSYDYGPNNWILTEGIDYNPRRSVVNLIVLDINDNAPIFVGKENEPITVGYPQGDIEEIVLPRALAELKATDADIGENAELLYWSSENNIVVAPTTGSVHVRTHAILEDNARLVVYATDRNGEGLTGSIELLVKLLQTNHIAVIAVRNAFLDDEAEILQDLTLAVGYEIKTLRTTVVSDKIEESTNNNRNERLSDTRNNTRKRRETETVGASLRLYVYGLRNSEPIDVTQLTRDLNSIVTVSLAQVVSLADHLEGLQICPVAEREVGLLAATIVLAGLLFILLVTIAVWYYLKWNKKQYDDTYNQFSNENSVASRAESIDQGKPETAVLPRVNLEELNNSKKSLQELLDAPIEEVNEVLIVPTAENELVSPKTVSYELPNDTIVNIPTDNPAGPIVIQSIDKLKDKSDESEDDDEFGEKTRTRRKSVVTFNENVEKIIHLEDRTDDESEPDIEVYEF